MKKAILFVFLISFNATSMAIAFECDSMPFEGIPFFRVKTDTLTLHQKASLESPVTQPVKVEKGSIISFKDTYAEIIRKRTQYGDSALIKSTDVINTKITLGKSTQRVAKPGIIKATKSGTFEVVEHYGPIKSCSDIGKIKFESVSKFTFKQGDIIEDLLYLGEGQCMMRFKGQVFLSDTCLGNVEGLERKSQPEHEWWFTVNENKKEIGWFKMTEKNDFLQLIDTVK
jgi:hypothetical protein